MTDTVFFIFGILAVLGLNIYVLHRINRQSYLHTPLRFPKLWSRRDQAMPEPGKTPELVQSQQEHKDYVEWFTSRNPAGQKQRQHLFESAPLSEESIEEQAFVGMAILDEGQDEKNENAQASPARKKGNVERWFEQAVNE